MLSNKEKSVIKKLIPIIYSKFAYASDNPDLCEKYSDCFEECVAVRCVMSDALFQTKTKPFILNLSNLDRYVDGLEKEWFIVQTCGDIRFKVMLPKPGFGSEPIVYNFDESADWLEDIDAILKAVNQSENQHL